MTGWRENYVQDGVARIARVLPAETVSQFREEFERLAMASKDALRPGAVFGLRNVLRDSPKVAQAALTAPFLDIARTVIGRTAQPIRAVLFDKTKGANWPLPWHQDRTAAIDIDAPLEASLPFRNWTTKQGLRCAELPRDFLEAMVTIRAHLDTCDQDTGALVTLNGAYRRGVLAPEALRQALANTDGAVQPANAGDVVVMSPLTPHRSLKATRPARRRVLHIEYCARSLPEGARWGEAA